LPFLKISVYTKNQPDGWLYKKGAPTEHICETP